MTLGLERRKEAEANGEGRAAGEETAKAAKKGSVEDKAELEAEEVNAIF